MTHIIIREHISTWNHIGELLLNPESHGGATTTTPFLAIGYPIAQGSTSPPWNLLGELTLNPESHRVISSYQPILLPKDIPIDDPE